MPEISPLSIFEIRDWDTPSFAYRVTSQSMTYLSCSRSTEG